LSKGAVEPGLGIDGYQQLATIIERMI